jgi:DNA-binding NtrC family response regulator
LISILVVDDNQAVAEFCRVTLSEAGHSVITAHSAQEALEALDRHPVDIILSDVRMPGVSGLELLGMVSKGPLPPSVILVTGFGSVPAAVEALKMGAYDYVEKPFSRERLISLVDRLIQARAQRTENLLLGQQLNAGDARHGIVGRSPRMVAVFESILRVADRPQPVLITGETGTGKERVALAIHEQGTRSGPFVAVDCGALSPHLVESELFGHVRGAFTGADRDRKGLLETSAGGTLFLDEIGELPLVLQAKFFRVLQDGEFRPLGSDRTRQFEGRVIAATNRDLEQAVRDGAFRAELYFRLNVHAIAVPPLRARRMDIPLLVHHFLQLFSDEGPVTIGPEALRILTEYDWPGNVRELQNCIIRMTANRPGPRLDVEDIPPLAGLSANPAPLSPLDEAEREVIARTLDEKGGNVVETARVLGVSRATLYRKMRALGLREARS